GIRTMNSKKTVFTLGLVVGAGALWAGAATAGGGRISLADIELALQAIGSERYVPYKVQINGGICNTAAFGSSNPVITIDSDGSEGTFSITSVSARTNGIPIDPALRISLNDIRLDGTNFDFPTNSLINDAFGGTAIDESFNILGADLRANSTSDPADYLASAGRVPHELVADSIGSNDVQFVLFCRSDVVDLQLDRIVVTGWKKASDTVTVTYTPGT
ncbi:MAG: hypothetical protein AAFQ99_14180, partial [Pseudomonadota bacterium]